MMARSGAASLKRGKPRKQAPRRKPVSAPGATTTPQNRLRDLMQAHNLTRQAVAQRLGVSIDTVHAWLRPQDNAGHRNMPARMLRLLELELAARR
jgi:DNA-binding transcriptional regulator YiaG